MNQLNKQISMEDLNIEGTPKTSTIRFDMKSGEMLFKGRSIPTAAELSKSIGNICCAPNAII